MSAFLDKVKSLPPLCVDVMCHQRTEPPREARPILKETGSFLCRRCGLALFRAEHQFSSECGWPAFDNAIESMVKTVKDKDGVRDEILCERCHGHLGHVFYGEGFTPRNVRYCVNTVAIDWVPDSRVMDTEEAIIAGGCFWGVEYYLNQLSGVLLAECGYTGGNTVSPSYEEVCRENTGHYEAVRILYDSGKTDYEAVIRRFFEIHDPTQCSGQGPDLGSQYQSAIFCYDDAQVATVKMLIEKLNRRGFDVVTKILPVTTFWKAESFHQHYYSKHHSEPYCHRPEARFGS